MTPTEAVRDGYDEIQHVNFLFLNFSPGCRHPHAGAVHRRRRARRRARPRVAGRCKRLHRACCKERNTVSRPDRHRLRGPVHRPRRARCARAWRRSPTACRRQVRRSLLGGGLPVPPGKDAALPRLLPRLLAMVRLLHDAGHPDRRGHRLASPASTSTASSSSTCQAGIPAPEVLRIATLGAARVMKLDERPRHDRPRQARRPDPGRRRPDAEHQRHPPRRPHRQGRHDLRPGGALPDARRQTGGVKGGRRRIPQGSLDFSTPPG